MELLVVIVVIVLAFYVARTVYETEYDVKRRISELEKANKQKEDIINDYIEPTKKGKK